MIDLKNRQVLVTGASGLIGIELVKLLVSRGAMVQAVSLDDVPSIREMFGENIEFIKGDLRDFEFCMKISKNKEFVFHLAGIKGSPEVAVGRPNTFFVNTTLFNLNVIEACRRNSVDHFLYTSSIGVYAPSSIFEEDSVWSTFPSPNDRFAGWAKRMGELQIEGAKLEHSWQGTYIVRPANVYGSWDNFDLKTAMVIPSLIARLQNGENPLRVWGDGSAIRDFVHAKDVARAMLFVMDNDIHEPVNVGSGLGISIKELANLIVSHFDSVEIEWDTSKPSGDKMRVMDMKRLTQAGFKPEISIQSGIKLTVEWFRNNPPNTGRYNAFREQS